MELCYELNVVLVVDESLENFIAEKATDDIKKILSQFDLDKKGRDDALDEIKETKIHQVIAELPDEDELKIAIAEDSKIVSNVKTSGEVSEGTS